jgi:hypothetical protein
MKKIYLSIVAAVSLMFVSCTADWLNTDPSTAVPSDDAIKNIDDAQVALNGIYRLASAHRRCFTKYFTGNRYFRIILVPLCPRQQVTA